MFTRHGGLLTLLAGMVIGACLVLVTERAAGRGSTALFAASPTTTLARAPGVMPALPAFPVDYLPDHVHPKGERDDSQPPTF